jgi:hypothetical protein
MWRKAQARHSGGRASRQERAFPPRFLRWGPATEPGGSERGGYWEQTFAVGSHIGGLFQMALFSCWK